jgi:hypothetical protein
MILRDGRQGTVLLATEWRLNRIETGLQSKLGPIDPVAKQEDAKTKGHGKRLDYIREPNALR